LTHFLLDAPGIREAIASAAAAHPPDVVLAFCSGMARFALEPPLDRFPFVLEMVDVDSRKWQELGERKRGPLGWIYRREARYLSRFEAEAARRARASVVVNERERDILKALAPKARVEAVPIGVDVAQFAPTAPAIASQDVVFCGVMNYTLNADGAIWMSREVWPRVRASHPDARFRIVGSAPTSAVQALASADQRIEVTGRVPDVRPYLWSAAVAVAPLLNARGVQTKVLEAVGSGLPCVLTPAVAAGLPPEVLPACVVAESPDAFADAVGTLLAMTPEARRAIVSRVDVSQLGWMQRLAPLRSILEDAANSISRT
jgi:sugar transferase (PEP-CTERM/EpsH1 system associated)